MLHRSSSLRSRGGANRRPGSRKGTLLMARIPQFLAVILGFRIGRVLAISRKFGKKPLCEQGLNACGLWQDQFLSVRGLVQHGKIRREFTAPERILFLAILQETLDFRRLAGLLPPQRLFQFCRWRRVRAAFQHVEQTRKLLVKMNLDDALRGKIGFVLSSRKSLGLLRVPLPNLNKRTNR
jgi:hypothetical protein